jgi:histidinol dehydrogenase
MTQVLSEAAEMAWVVHRPSDPDYDAALASLDRHAEPSEKVAAAVRSIIAQVRAEGDTALVRLAAKFDQVALSPGKLRLEGAPQPALASAAARALRKALGNIRKFSKRGIPKDWEMRNQEGARVGEMYKPFRRVGIYVPGGTAPLVSTALMTVGIAQVAAVPEIVVTTPPPVDANLHGALLMAGATEIYQTGGAQAIAALAFGTSAIRRVEKIFGPGNAYVVEAKRQVVGAVAIDQLPGPSEILVVADETCDPAFVAADLLAQAEHGPGSQIMLIAASEAVLDAVGLEMRLQFPSLSRQEYLAPVIKTGCRFVLARSLQHAIEIAEAFAPEHLALCIRKARAVARKIRHAGAIFLGNDSPVAAGDFVAGPSHTLPTGGAAKSFPGLTIDQFFRRTSIVEYHSRSIAKAVPIIEAMAHLEHLDAHAASARIRLAKP